MFALTGFWGARKIRSFGTKNRIFDTLFGLFALLLIALGASLQLVFLAATPNRANLPKDFEPPQYWSYMMTLLTFRFATSKELTFDLCPLGHFRGRIKVDTKQLTGTKLGN
jgi:hypothetical protein